MRAGTGGTVPAWDPGPWGSDRGPLYFFHSVLMAELGRRPDKSPRRITLIIAAGFVLGALVTELMALTLPASAARQFFITTVSASLGPLTVDLHVVALTVGPLILRANILSVVGVLLVAWFARSLL
jgi:hypothetical protein